MHLRLFKGNKGFTEIFMASTGLSFSNAESKN